MRVVIAPDSFKGSLSAADAAGALATGWRRARARDEIVRLPLADGGEGTVEALTLAAGGTLCAETVCGPLGEPVEAQWGLIEREGHRTGVIEMAAASGLTLVEATRRNPLETTTRGTGELMRAALERGCDRLIVGIGGSATTDGGVGMAQALGVRFTLDEGVALTEPGAGRHLARIAAIDLSERDVRVLDAEISVACDVTNPLHGPEGAAHVYAPQKGATPEQVVELDAGLAHLARVVARDVGGDIASLPGAGAAGGLGGGLVAFCGGRLLSGIDLAMEAVGFDRRIAHADLVLTGEGRIDEQTIFGKVVAGVARHAAAQQVPVVAFGGSVAPGARETLAQLGLRAIVPININGWSLGEAMARGRELLEETAAQYAAGIPLRTSDSVSI